MPASVTCKPRGDLPIDLCGCSRVLVYRFIMADDVNNVEIHWFVVHFKRLLDIIRSWLIGFFMFF